MIKKLLLVDDDPGILESLKFILSDQGFEIRTAQSAADCGCMMDDYLPDLVVMDINMPGITGDKAIEFMVNNQRLRHVHFLVVSGYIGTELRDKLERLKVPSLAKPVEPDTLIATIESLNYTSTPAQKRAAG